MTQDQGISQEYSSTPNPFTVTAIFYLIIAIITSMFSYLALTDIYELRGISWIRVHVITLGVVTQFIYGYLTQIDDVDKTPNRAPNWLLWAILNTGILTFLTGRAYLIKSLILSGGVILFIATIYLFYLLIINTNPISFTSGKLYYLSGILYFLLGIILGTGIWMGWSDELAVGNILEVHIHANNWGLLSFVFAGLFLDKYEDWFGFPLHKRSNFMWIYYLLMLGTFGLVVGPWIGSLVLIVPGLLFHLIATGMIIYNITRPIYENKGLNNGFLHVLTAYFWFLAPVFIAPLVILGVPGIPGHVIEQRAPEALIFGWALQVIIFVILHRDTYNNIEWSPTSLIFIHLGALCIWIGIFSTDVIYGMGYLFFSIGIIPVVISLIKRQWISN